jgi:ABC-type nitrate/sulfonate/bicarbonate transport system substrate-binding protein
MNTVGTRRRFTFDSHRAVTVATLWRVREENSLIHVVDRGGRRPRRSPRLLAGAVLGSITVLVLAACGSSAGAGDGGDGGGGDAGPSQLTVGYFPLVHTATAVQAQEAGHFEAADLDVELQQTAGGAQAIPSLVAGELDITYGNYTSALLAAQQGLPVRIIAGNDVGADDHALMVAPDAPYQRPEDLSGARIAVVNLSNIGTIAINAVLEDAGVDISTIQYVELPFPDMAAALSAGDVDAIWQVEPFQASALASGARVLFKMFEGPVEGMPVAGWLTTEQYAQENPEVIEAFRTALDASIKDLDGNRERLVELVPTYTQVPAQVVEQVALPDFDSTVDDAQLQKMADLMLKYEVIDEEFDVSSIIVQ